MKNIKKRENATLKGIYKITLENKKTGEKKVYEFENIVPTVGKTLFMNNLTSEVPDNDILVSHVALGTGTTPVAITDTALETEVYRNAVASRTNSANIGYVSGFFSADEVTGTFYEAGIFCGGSLTPDSGTLLSHVLLNPPTGITKGGTLTLTIDWTLQLS